MSDLLALVEQDIPLRRVASTNGGEWAGPCPGCGGRDRFRCWPSKGRYWCRGCGKRGDSIEYLRAFHGLSYAEARRQLGLSPVSPSSKEAKKQRAHRHALAVARRDYETWARQKMIAVIDEYRELPAEIEIAEIAYRLLCRRPDLFTDVAATYWLQRLGRLYDHQAVVEDELDIVTFKQYEQELFVWWQEESNGGRIPTR